MTRKVWKKTKLGHKYLNVTYFSTLFRKDSDVTAPQTPSVRGGLCTQGFLTEETSPVSPNRPAEEDSVTALWELRQMSPATYLRRFVNYIKGVYVYSPRLTKGYIYFQVSLCSIYAQITLERDQETPKMTHRKCWPSPPYLPTVHCTGHWSDSDETRDCVLCPNDDQV